MQTLTQLRRLGLFDARVPRYTSYPTAPHFKPGFGPEVVADWIKAIPSGDTVSLYVHIPFCRRLCWFCACRTQGTATAEPVRAYLDTLKQELATLKGIVAPGVKIEHLHWGGGTPTLLQPEMITELTAAILDTMPLADEAQFSVEIDPSEVDGARLDALAEAGMNRASIGVQDFDPMIQEVIGRPQSYEITKETVDGLRERGITSLNMDILYGLPHQNEARITDSVNKLISLAPDRVALFGYAHVPWMARRQNLIPTDALPTPEGRLELFNTARNLFLEAGFDEIGIDHFAKPGDGLATAHKAGTMRRNFQGYTEDSSEVLIGIGASSISRYPQGYAQNEPATSKYQAAARAGTLTTAKGHAFDHEDRVRGRIIELLLCDFEVDFAQVAEELNDDPARLAAMADGLDEAMPETLEFEGSKMLIRKEAYPLARIIARYFDAYEMNEAGHSQAV
ncbi:oxygen-independent coproporphyrinogen III oxidase [Aliiroseovarius crassostreae]|uniref:oxygen-independent coproporphyrinogen III oxidase n=1 Tax=Aliiroseovarius crassostreae TaxID=154981 RepID=UPI0021AEB4A5|nr:oxygen-independent coproporphyrinogen III oxidase [Aliiroseovarius crassostreae]UWP92762.1 oxygen-independent coproporphyrinogen III oxidase [Aliiroseovarius crassostreae]UWQ11611.1 oxygen-independent coproporphyrinogen III oxidase [Aliiroseovarius crassostreae]